MVPIDLIISLKFTENSYFVFCIGFEMLDEMTGVVNQKRRSHFSK